MRGGAKNTRGVSDFLCVTAGAFMDREVLQELNRAKRLLERPLCGRFPPDPLQNGVFRVLAGIPGLYVRGVYAGVSGVRVDRRTCLMTETVVM